MVPSDFAENRFFPKDSFSSKQNKPLFAPVQTYF